MSVREELIGVESVHEGKGVKFVRYRLIREVLDKASSPLYNVREARRAKERKTMWTYASLMGRNRKEKRAWFRKTRSEQSVRKQQQDASK